MHTFTALFDHRADAEAVQARLEQLGIIDIDHNVSDRDAAGSDKGLWGSGKGAVPPDEDRHMYEEAVRRGGFLLTVNSDDAQAARVHEVLEGSKAVDFDERTREMKAAGFVPPVPVAPPVRPTATAADEDRIQLAEERLVVGKRQVERGGVRVRAYTVETPVSEQVRLREEHVDIERRPVNRQVGDADAVFQERSFEMTETAEQAVAGKQTVITEEIGLHKKVGQRTETVSDTVRRTEVEVEDTRTAQSGTGVGGFGGQVREHAEVVGSDGVHVGVVDHVDGGRIKLAKRDSGDGRHHYIPMSWIGSVAGDKVHLSIPSAQAVQEWTAAG